MRCLFTLFVLLFVYVEGCKGTTRTVHLNKDVPIQEQLKDSNAIYIIDRIIDLNGETITIPKDSKLEFSRKSKLMNGTIIGGNTEITGFPTFENLRLKGTFTNNEFKVSWNTPHTMSDYIEDVMNLNETTVLYVDKDITLSDSKRYVNHLNLNGNGKIITNSDRFYITYGGCDIRNLIFHWNKGPFPEPKDNYNAVVIYSDLLLKDTIINIKIENVVADGGRYCSYFMKQYKSSIHPSLRTINKVENSQFINFTRGVIWTCGGSGNVTNCQFRDIGYESSSTLLDVTALRLGYSYKIGGKAKAIGYNVYNCTFNNIVAAYNQENDGRGLHGLLVYGDSIQVKNNIFRTLSTSFTEPINPGMDSEILYIKGSNNIIINNEFENGAGSSSDAVVTLKIAETEGNIIKGNYFYTSYNNSVFVKLGGRHHIIEGNIFKSTYGVSRKNLSYAIYLSHHNQDIGNESIKILDNVFSFTGDANYMAVYANRWGDITMIRNTFQNLNHLLKCNNRGGHVTIKDNTIILENIKCDENDIFVTLSGDADYQADIFNNNINMVGSKVGYFMWGSKYFFKDNKIALKNTSIGVMFRGKDAQIEVHNNVFSIDGKSTIIKPIILEGRVTPNYKIGGNKFVGRKKIQSLL